jgi:hypothetical protein
VGLATGAGVVLAAGAGVAAGFAVGLAAGAGVALAAGVAVAFIAGFGVAVGFACCAKEGITWEDTRISALNARDENMLSFIKKITSV